ncbi:hypothetical protein GGR54DRAFT_642694 [Hypoxylon sp. NC1633]|nr:hypothetical protein GGR54DRAFT_642694 [Hypoxylon sp. NC1633]
MPALNPTLLLESLAVRNVTVDPTNATNPHNVMQVVCAWPVSGQYGPGSRFLYYALVATCVLARKAEWLRNACLAAALVFPAVAAVHGVVLAAVHVDGAVDMDVYGAFQFCSIGILAAPLTVRISRTYFYDPGRNIIFLWTGIVFAGLLSLTVEFFRSNTSSCSLDASGQPFSPDNFPYQNDGCDLRCSIAEGPASPLRQDSTNNIYVIPAPNILTFAAATLLAAACCIPAILSLASMWNKILEINWETKFGHGDENQLIEGTNGATVKEMSKVNTMVKLFLSTIEIPVFSAAVIAILAVGERNFWSEQVNYQTEPIQGIGQVSNQSYTYPFSWAPLVGTGFAALGSLYMLLAIDLDATKNDAIKKVPEHHCDCSHRGEGSVHHPSSEHIENTLRGGSAESNSKSPEVGLGISSGLFTGSSHSVTSPGPAHLRPSSLNDGRESSPEDISTADQIPVSDAGNRRKVAKVLTAVSNYLGTAAQDRFDDNVFNHGPARDYPEIPAEPIRNPNLHRVRDAYNQHHEDESVTPGLSKRPSRSGSFTGSIASRPSEGSPTISRVISAPYPQSQSPSPSPVTLGVRQSSTLPVEQGSFELQSHASPSPAGPTRGRSRQRRDTLEVPIPFHHSSSRSTQSASPVTTPGITTISNDQGSPTIIISPDPDTESLVEETILGSPIVPHPH